MVDTNKLTREGFDKFEKELAKLTQQKRPKAVARLKLAREMGDLSENSEYVAAREELNFIDDRIGEIKALLQSSRIVESNTAKNEISLGHSVRVKSPEGVQLFTIVSEPEADITQNKLSNKSPIGKSLLGKRKGDKISIDIPTGKILYEILDIS